MKKHKSHKPVQASSSNGIAELFVLPPELLAKLGIDLGKIQDTEVHTPATNKGSEQSVECSKNSSSERNDASSIIETANLMKESVFLSPTFIQNASNIPEEDDILSKEVDAISYARNVDTENIAVYEQIMPKTFSKNIEMDSNHGMHNHNLNTKESYKSIENKKYEVENHGGNLILTDIPLPHNNGDANINYDDIKTISLCDEHQDEAYMSDYSNTHSGCSPETVRTDIIKHKFSKMKDESSEVNIEPSQSNHQQNSWSSKQHLKPFNANGTNISNISTNVSHVNIPYELVNEKPITIINGSETIENNNLSIPTSSKNIISWTQFDQRQKEIEITMIEYNHHNNTAIQINDPPKMTKHDETKFEDVISACESSDDESLSTLKIKLSDKGDNLSKQLCVNDNNTLRSEKIHNESPIIINVTNNNNEKLLDAGKHFEIKQHIVDCDFAVKNHCKIANLNVLSEDDSQLLENSNKSISIISHREQSDDTYDSDQSNTDGKKNARLDESDQNSFVVETTENTFKIKDCAVIRRDLKNAITLGINKRITITEQTNEERPPNNSIVDQPSDDLVIISKSENALNPEKSMSPKIIESDNKKDLIQNKLTNDDKVREIADYLSKIVNERKELTRKIKTQRRIKTKAQISSNKLESDPQGFPRRDRNSIQEEYLSGEKVLKTYGKSIKGREKPRLITISGEALTLDSFQLLNKEIKTDALSSHHNFCLCYDFGSLAYYDCEMLYEHIHFWQHKSISYDSDILFSIYNDDYVVSKSLDLNDDQVVKDDDSTTIDNIICWNATSIENNGIESASKISSEMSLYLENISPKVVCSKSSPSIAVDAMKNVKSDNNKAVKSEIGKKSSVAVEEVTESNELAIKKVTDTVVLPSRASLELGDSSLLERVDKISQHSMSKERSIDDYLPTKKGKISESDMSATEMNRSEISGSDRRKHNRKTSDVELKGKSVSKKVSTKTVDVPKNDAPSISTPKTSSFESKVIKKEKVVLKADTMPSVSDAQQEDLPNLSSMCKSNESSSNIDTISKCVADSEETVEVYVEIEVPPQSSDHWTRCGVCHKGVQSELWDEHLAEHNYLAWRADEPALDLENSKTLQRHVQDIVKKTGKLVCSNCGIIRKFAKPFLRHIENCVGDSEEKEDDISLASLKDEKPRSSRSSWKDDPPRRSRASLEQSSRRSVALSVTCGVCDETIHESAWIEHIRLKHKYLAWKKEDDPIELDNEDEVKKHLNYISKNYGGLTCSKCGSKWNYVKKFLLHEQLCGRPVDVKEQVKKQKQIEVALPTVVVCGVCKMEVEGKDWIMHILRAHQYMAWVEGETPVDKDDAEQVKAHLSKIVKMAGELCCLKCGETRKYERSYSQHIIACNTSGFEVNIEPPVDLKKGEYECGVCHKRGELKDWSDHAMLKHYNVAWRAGDVPINILNPYAVEKYLKEYRKKYNLVCRVCKQSRTSCYGFYAHIITCGKTEEELDVVHNLCDICNKKYLCIYKNQHIAMHKDQIVRKERRELKAKLEEEKAAAPPEPILPKGKRRAAEKARKVMAKISSNVIDGKPVCACGFLFQNAEEMSQHQCNVKVKHDSDVDMKLEPEHDEESDDNVDIIDEYYLSDDEVEQKKKKRLRTGEGTTKITRMAYRVNSYPDYLTRSYKDFCRLHYTSDYLFNEWRNSPCKVVAEDDVKKYLPPLTESCKVKIEPDGEWTTYTRFESKKRRGYSIFTGGTIQCMSWAPHNIKDESMGEYLAVSSHLASDVPRYAAGDLPQHPGLLQIWSFKQFNMLPNLALGIAHDYGVVWAMDWCPSGARDRLTQKLVDDSTTARLGLLAIACSNGTAYILAVPFPLKETTNDDHTICKLKPVAELRISMSTERKVYQATCVSWSQQKGHSVIIVGYSDGTIALYDLNTESPILKTTVDDVTVYYPFQDKLAESSSITGVDICPTTNKSYSIGGYCSSSITGCSMSSWPAPAPSVRSHLPASAAHYTAHWPAVYLAGDVPFSTNSVTEMEWWGGGRRHGAGRACATCARCARSVAAASPAVRLLRHHPCYPETKKQIIAMLLMVPLAQKRKLPNDDLSVVIEPLTYQDAVQKYGLQLNLVAKNEQVRASKICNENELYPERFPLSDVVAVAFCNSARFHEKITLATHSGFVFVIHG